MYYSFSTYMYIINEHHMIYGFWNVRCNREKFLSFWVNFCPFGLLTTQKIKILKLKKSPGILSFYTFVPYMTIIWCMFPEIWSVKDRMFLTFWTIFCPFTPPPLSPSNNPKSQNFKKMKKLAEDIIIWYRCTINDNYMMYGSWDIERVRHNFLSFGPFYALLLP